MVEPKKDDVFVTVRIRNADDQDEARLASELVPSIPGYKTRVRFANKEKGVWDYQLIHVPPPAPTNVKPFGRKFGNSRGT